MSTAPAAPAADPAPSNTPPAPPPASPPAPPPAPLAADPAPSPAPSPTPPAADPAPDPAKDTPPAAKDTPPPAAKDTPPPAKAPAKTPDSVLSDDEDGGEEPASAWPADWREKYAGEDEKKLNTLKRYASPQAAFDALFAAQARIKAGGLAKPLPKDATPEQIAEWRQHNGIPDKPEDYKIELKEGFVLGDEDKPYVDRVLAAAHSNNAHPSAVNAIIQSYLEQREAAMADQVKADRTYNAQTIETLKADWGPDFDAHKNTVMGFLDAAPPEVKNSILTARDGDGNLLRNNAAFLKFIVGRELEYNPAATIVPGAGRDHLSGVEDEIATIEKRMREDRAGYNKDARQQERYMQLLTAREKLKART